MTAVMNFGRMLYRFKPARTFAQVLAGALGTARLTGIDWLVALDVAGGAAVACFLLIWAEGGELMGADKRVTKSLS